MTIEVGKDGKIVIEKKTTLQSGDNLTITGKKKVLITAQDEITLKCGSASIILKKNGDIQISGNKINIKGSGDVQIKGSKIAQN
jgi:type VI secretion system secreted protein VgrG